MKIKSVQKTLVALLCITLFSNCGDSNKAKVVNLDATPHLSDFVTEPTFTLSSEVPHDITNITMPYPTNISIEHLSRFAWKEFVALNWPADPTHRGKPDTSKTIGDTSSANVVWETYWHRAEMFPYDENPEKSTLSKYGLASYVANTTSKPSYKYDPASFTFKGNYGGTGTGDSTLFNNLSENNELDIDQMFAGTVKDDNRILYEAKMNETGFNYIIEKELYKDSTRGTFTTTSKITANLKAYGSSCDVTAPNIVCLPCGDNAGSEGNIEIKASWRKLTTAEIDSAKYYTNEVITYRSSKTGGRQYFNETYGLIGLHIIHKTKNFPSFIYATFEHEDLIDDSLSYIDEITQTGRGTGDTYGDTIAVTSREHAIPAEVDSVTKEVHKAFGSDNVFSHYKLVGVQAYPVDCNKLKKSDPDSVSTFYLANLAIETNQELQSFTGTIVADQRDTNNIYTKGKFLNMGGCMGCHGVSQSQKGSDFNFLIANAPFTVPEFVGKSSMNKVRPINSYSDVQKMFNDFVINNSINVNGSPHKSFWDKLTYNKFITENVPHVDNVKICNCGDSTTSNIVNVLKGQISAGGDISQMPFGGPYFNKAQIAEFAKWIENGCPDPAKKPDE